MISIQNVSKSFGKVAAVTDVSLEIEQGEFFSLLGSSGSGKSTLLRMIAGFEGLTRGEIVIDGQKMSDVPPHHRPINMVFQNYAIFPHLNVRDNIAYGLRKLKKSRAEQNKMVDEMLDQIALPGYGDRRSNELSGGQLQRVALARALILKPKVLLLDEPLGALDKQLREQMQLELRALQRSVGITFVFVTHDQEEALTLSDRVAVMANGRVLQVDTPEGLYETPRTREVAGFVGNMNFFDATLHLDDGKTASLNVKGLGKISVLSDSVFQPDGAAVQIALRPEKIIQHDTKPKGIRSLRGEIQSVAYLGELSHYFVRVEGLEKPIAVSEQNEDRVRDVKADMGEPIWLSWNDSAVVVLRG